MKEVENITLEEIKDKYDEYVQSFEGEQRHMEEVQNDVNELWVLCSKLAIDQDSAEILYDKMLDVATSYEESGFMAGYKNALA